MNNTFKDIKSVVFDLDDTLFLTRQYYTNEILESVQYVLDKTGDRVHTLEDLLGSVIKNHKKDGKPVLLNILIEKTIDEIYGEELKSRDEIFKYIDNRIENFYLNVPQLVPSTLEVINYVNSKKVSISVYSHAQREWTERKVKYLQEKYLEKYNNKIEIQSYSTEIDAEKNSDGWNQALNNFGFIPEYTLVIGDNMKSDIIPAKEIGVRKLILVTSMYSENGTLEDSNGVTKVKNLEDIINL